MIGVGWALNLVAAVSWSVNDVLRKRLAIDTPPVPLAAWLSLGPVPLFVAWAMWQPQPASWDGYWVAGLGSLGLNLIANVLFVTSLRMSPLATTIPVLSLTPALSTLGAWAILGEAPPVHTVVAIGVVVAGALVLPFAGGLSMEQLRGQVGVPMMAGVAVCWSLTMVLDKLGAAQVGVPVHLAIVTGGVGVLLSLGLLVTGRGEQLWPDRGQLGWMVVVMLAVAIATGTQLLALERLSVAVVDGTKRAAGMGLAALVGRLWFGETLTWMQGAVLLALGVAMVVMGL